MISVLGLVWSPRHSVIDSPLPDAIEVPASVRCAVVRPRVSIVKRKVETEHTNVALAHDELSQCVNAVIEMAREIRGRCRCVSSQRRIVVLIDVLSQQI